MRRRLAARAGLPLLLAACGTLDAPPAEATLLATGAAAELDRATQRALDLVAAAPDDAAVLVAASRCLFQAADFRLQQATTDWLAAHPAATRAEVVAADDQIAEAVRIGIASLCTRGLELADRAAAKAPGDVHAKLHQALHVSLLAFANGPARALFAGYGPKLVAAIDAAVALDPTVEGAAPLRLSGRFRGKAPWPYGDLAAAETALARAVELAPVVVNHLFLGDVLLRRGRNGEAEAHWRAAAAAADDPSAQWSGALLRAQARARLAARP
ncbi:MAG: hypothetical protein JNK15_03295 [Planctomycetes bacterium]|nr:hypothetical protein [Planctomycetota bacterium]